MSGADIFILVCLALQTIAVGVQIYYLIQTRKYNKETAKIIEDMKKGDFK